MALPFSKSEITRAGDTLRQWRLWQENSLFTEVKAPSEGAVAKARGVLNEYRSLWEAPPDQVLLNETRALGEIVKQGGLSVVRRLRPGMLPTEVAQVSSRLKRVDRIINKLVHYPRMNLARMEDVGGCRVVLPNLAALRAAESRIRELWQPNLRSTSREDYITYPKETGYRAVHLVVMRGELMVEIQLRTLNQNLWATLVEDYENWSGVMLKRGVGKPEVLELFDVMSECMAYADRGEPPPPDSLRRLRHLTATVPTGRA